MDNSNIKLIKNDFGNTVPLQTPKVITPTDKSSQVPTPVPNKNTKS